MDDKILQLVNDKKYTEFSDSIKDVFKDKVSNHEYMKEFTSKYQEIQNMKKAFTDITTTYGTED